MGLGYKKGFTLLEIIATISLILVIMSMAVPMYTNIVDKQKLKTDLAVAMQLSQCAKTFYIENKSTDGSALKKYIEEIYDGEMPKSKYIKNEEFTVSLDRNGKASVKAGGMNFIESGKVSENLPKDGLDKKDEI